MPLVQYKNGVTFFTAPVGNPEKPANGDATAWVSDGTGLGNAGDMILASTISGTTKYTIIHAYSSGVTW